jgi:2-keto-4-pentenoate hydratase/2-oxohepta-3-ene-1,7-dioic acid hydratase in catechol pathway
MKIAQIKYNGNVRLATVEGESISVIEFEGGMRNWIIQGGDSSQIEKTLPMHEVEFAPPVMNPSKIIAVGLNYLDHAAEGKANVPETPLIFCKFPNSLLGAGQEIKWMQSVTRKVDFEAELAVIIGKQTFGISENEALSAVFGYTCGNDISARDLQFGDKQWVRGKSLDTFCPLGPWIVTADEIGDPQALNIRSILNGEIMQESNTQRMIFSVAHLVHFTSRHFTLLPGDIIMTGTPSGVGVFRDPPIFLNDRDEIRIEIEGIGVLKNHCRVTP